MRRSTVILFFAIISTNIFQVQAQDKQWSIQNCIDYAFENNITIKQQKLNAEYSENEYLRSKVQILPNLNGNASHNYNFGRSVDPYTNQFSEENVMSDNFSLSSSVTIFNGLQNLNTIKKNKYNLMANLEDVEKAKNDIALNIAAAYLQILLNEELLGVAQDQLGISQLQVERTKKLVDAGSLAKGSLLEIESQAAFEGLQVVNRQNQLDFSYLSIVQLLDIDSVGGFVIEQPQIEEPEKENYIPSINQVYLESSQTLPQIKSAEYNLKSSEKDLAIAKGTRSPRLTLSGGYGTGYSDAREKYVLDGTINPATGSPNFTSVNYAFKDQLKDNGSKSLAFGLSIPIFNGWQTNTAISNAKISVLNSEYTLELTKNQLYKEIQQAHADAKAALNKYIATKKSVTFMEESFRYTQQKFDVGMVNSVDYNVAKNQLLKVKSDLLQAKYEYVFKLKILDFYRGNPIKL